MLRFLDFTNLSVYRLYFMIIFVVLIPLIYLIRQTERLTDWHIKDVLGIFISFRDIRALFTLNRLEKNLNIRQEDIGVTKLQELPSHLSEAKLLEYLESPRFTIRAKALSALGQIKFGYRTRQALIREVQRGEFTTAYIAADILGQHKVKEAIPILRQALHSADIYLQGKSMLSLAQLGDKKSYPEIERIFIRSTNPRIILHGARAILEMGDIEKLRLLLDKVIWALLPQQIKEELLFTIAEMCGCGDEFYRFLKDYKINRSRGKATMLEIIQQFSKMSGLDLSNFENFINKILEDDKCDCEEISAFLKQQLNQPRTTLSGILKQFFSNLRPDQLYLELVYCLMLIIAKDAGTK